MDAGVMGAMIPIVAIIGGLSMAAYGMHLRMKARQLMHQERLAMIEKGLTPPPLTAADLGDFLKRRRSSRHTGVIMIAVGIGFSIMVGYNAEMKGHALGVGAMLVVMGLGFLLNAMLDQREASKRNSTGSASETEPPR